MSKRQVTASRYVQPLNINRLEGRLLRYPSNKKHQKQILFVYGQHSTIERWWSLAQALHDYGNVTIPDLPGLGGMDSFYKIGKQPTIDNYAAYLASIIKMQYKTKPFILIATGFGFAVATRTLQRYPAIAKQVQLLVSLDGPADKEDFALTKADYYLRLSKAKLLNRRVMAFSARHLALKPSMLNYWYSHDRKHVKPGVDLSELIETETWLWQTNDFRTEMYIKKELLTFTNCDRQVDLDVWHVANAPGLDMAKLEQHMKVIFSDFTKFKTRSKGYTMAALKNKKLARQLLPLKLRKAIIKA